MYLSSFSHAIGDMSCTEEWTDTSLLLRNFYPPDSSYTANCLYAVTQPSSFKLYCTISTVKAPIPKEAEVEPTFSSFEDADNSAVRVESLRDHLVDGVIVDGVAVDDDGYLARAGVAETVEASDEHFDPSDADFLPKESHVDASGSFKKMESIGRCTRQRPKLLGGEAKWEEH
ncbi:hypothetical protein C8J56DRAFT_895034 [Mycena floridula]|nr:hypothetical protein C8J56DRAFT_895034 [Mycena floridula]